MRWDEVALRLLDFLERQLCPDTTPTREAVLARPEFLNMKKRAEGSYPYAEDQQAQRYAEMEAAMVAY